MCLAIPGKVEEIRSEGGLLVGRVNFGGVVKRVCLDYVPEVNVGDYTIVHVGFAISKIDEATAEQTLAEFRALGVLDEELASEEEVFARAAERPQCSCPDGSCGTDSGVSGVSGVSGACGASSGYPSSADSASSASRASSANRSSSADSASCANPDLP